MNLWQKLKSHSVLWLIRLACFLGLAALGLMVLGVLVPQPLPVIASMSIAQGLGAAALGSYLMAIFMDRGA